MIKKLKNWLIIKLGGYIAPSMKIERITVEPVTICASTGISRYELSTMPDGEANMYVKEELARHLAREIIDKNMCVIEFTTDDFRDYVIYKTNIRVIPTLREYKDNE